MANPVQPRMDSARRNSQRQGRTRDVKIFEHDQAQQFSVASRKSIDQRVDPVSGADRTADISNRLIQIPGPKTILQSSPVTGLRSMPQHHSISHGVEPRQSSGPLGDCFARSDDEEDLGDDVVGVRIRHTASGIVQQRVPIPREELCGSGHMVPSSKRCSHTPISTLDPRILTSNLKASLGSSGHVLMVWVLPRRFRSVLPISVATGDLLTGGRQLTNHAVVAYGCLVGRCSTL